MSETEPQSVIPQPRRRWYRLTPGRFLVGLLALEGFLLLSERFEWFAFNQLPGCVALMMLLSVGLTLVLLLLWFVVSLLFRWRFQFGIRSLLLLVVGVAIPCAVMKVVWDRQREQSRIEEDALTHIQAAGGTRTSSFGNGPLGWEWVTAIRFYDRDLSDDGLADLLPYLKCLRELDYLNLDGTSVSDKSVAILSAAMRDPQGLRRLHGFRLNRTQVTDAGLKHLTGLNQLQSLMVNGTRITDAGLEYLKGLAKLKSLSLDDTNITDTGLKHVKELTQLEYLFLEGTLITDAGLEHIKALTHLRRLNLKGTKVTYQGVKKLPQALPNCETYWEPPTKDERQRPAAPHQPGG